MKNGLSIRLRLTLWYSAVLLLGLALFAGALWLALEHRLIAAVDERLAQHVEGIESVLAIEGPASTPQQLDEELAEFAEETPDAAFELRDGAGAFLLRSRTSWIEAAGRGGYRILKRRIYYQGRPYEATVAIPLQETRAVMRDFRALLLMLTPLVLLAACAGGYWISRRALAPVDAITQVAQSISLHSLGKRLPVPRTGDELARMSEAWNDVLERLEHAVDRIRRFTADASHELRTPIALIRGTAELALRRERDAEEYRRSLREIEAEADRMAALTDSLLELARADAGAAMPLAAVDLNVVAREAVRRNEAPAAAKGVCLRAQTGAGAALAAANDAAIRRLLLILVDNALKYTPRGGDVTVSVERGGEGVTLAVRDTGEGIDPAALPHIFERFYQADPARSENAGAGLGLSIARMIAEAHGGAISVESAPGAGSRFRLVLRAWDGPVI